MAKEQGANSLIRPTHERMFYNALVKFRDEQLENYQGQPLEYSASDYHHISRPGGKPRRGRSQNGRNGQKRRSHISALKDARHRITSPQEPKSCASVESYDPYRSPKNQKIVPEAQYAQITIHRAPADIPEEEEVSPVVNPPPSIAEEEEPEDVDEADNSQFTVLQKRKHKPNSMKSFQSSKVPHSSSRCPGLSTRSTSYRRNVSFRHARNKSQGSTKPKRRKTAQNQNQSHHTDLKRSPSAASLQMIADGVDVPPMPSSPPLPEPPTVVRPSRVRMRSLGQARKVRESDIIWKEDTRKVSHELSQICEEAFNGSSVTTIRTTSTGTGYETPATPVSVASQDQSVVVPIKCSAEISNGTPKESGRSFSIQELTETRRKLIEHSKGRNDNIPTYLSGVIGHLDRLIEQDQQQHGYPVDRERNSLMDPFITAEEPSLPVITEEFASPVRGAGEMTPKLKHKPRLPPPGQRGGDNRNTIRMVPHSSLASMNEVKPLMIRKKATGLSSDLPEKDFKEPSRNFSANSRQSRNACGLDRIEEAPASPERNTGSYSKKWSWFRKGSQPPASPPALPPKDRKPIIPSNGTVVHTPVDLTGSPTKTEEARVPTRKTSMERFGGTLLKKLMPKKSNKNMAQSDTGKLFVHFSVRLEQTLRISKDKSRPSSKDQNQNSTLMCKEFSDPESSFEADDLHSPPPTKRHSLAHHNWFARVFQIKPASRVIALNTSKVKGRKEVYKLLREWRDYGMEDVYMDKNNSTVHGRVSEANCKFPNTAN